MSFKEDCSQSKWDESLDGTTGQGSDRERMVSLLSSWRLSQPLEAVKKVTRSPNRLSSSQRGENRDLVSERTPESSLVEQELLSPLLKEWNSPDDKGLGVTSGKDRLLLRLGAPSLVVISSGCGKDVASDPGDRVLLALFRFMDGGGGSSLGIVHLSKKTGAVKCTINCVLT